jgi:hypothetical protein
MFHPDVYLIILHKLDDLDLDNMCYINKVLHQITINSNFWYVKCQPYQLSFLNLKPQYWKALYYKIKYNQWHHLIQYAEKHQNTSFLNWIIKQPSYINYVNQKVKQFDKHDAKYITQKDTLYSKIKQFKLVEHYCFIYTHRYYFDQVQDLKFIINYQCGTEFNYLKLNNILVDLCEIYLEFYKS